MNTNKLYNEMNQTFMGHKVDGIIIQPPMEIDEDMEMFMAAERQLALERLNRETLNVLEVLKDE